MPLRAPAEPPRHISLCRALIIWSGAANHWLITLMLSITLPDRLRGETDELHVSLNDWLPISTPIFHRRNPILRRSSWPSCVSAGVVSAVTDEFVTRKDPRQRTEDRLLVDS